MNDRMLLRRCALFVATLCIALGTAGCASTRPWSNAALAVQETVQYDGLAQLFDSSRLPDVLVVANFSGGGSRAASFAHAVLSELDAAPFVWRGQETTLTREIDMVTGVSGGSVTAAHLALHGAREHLRRFPADFLDVDFQGRLVSAALSPRNLYRLSSPWYGRGHVLADELDDTLFKATTFGQLSQLKGRPYLIIGATDLSTGAEFNFTSDRLALLCSSIDHVPLAIAVASSSAVPVLFSPLTLQNHSEGCAQRPRTGPGGSAAEADSARVRLVKGEFESMAGGRRPFIHLVDGGLSDNLGTRRLTDYVAKAGGVGAVMSMLGLGQSPSTPVPRRIVLISVNSESNDGLPIDRSGAVPGMADALGAMIFGGLGRFSKETSLVLSDAVEQWRKELRSDPRWAAESQADIFSIEIKLTDLDDSTLRTQVLEIPTAFRISEEARSLLRLAARRGLDQSAEFRRFLNSVQATP
ncbi:NTE family protein [Rubrivivax sp. A210]|uniref:patatin-like phospholipase family protein n=1 Tax=Rubrivivax sp. A210 TaxID=2772301 RepID=UPI00191854B5|nr:patatin-like phospholipase family protein [Rubrivivax sp. A210]CAD5366731.1 NTE family protein [Rubrivivax sp. A210]